MLAQLYDRVRTVIPPLEWELIAPKIETILQLKKERGAVVLAHNYQAPEIFFCVSDIVGDSFQLAIEAAKTKADIIVQCGVHFMAETSKLLNPDKMVLIPDKEAGCSLAASITREDVLTLKKAYPGRPVVSYINTSAEVKSVTDICCTSSNAVKIVESLGVPEVIFLPDRYLAANIAGQTNVKLIAWHGTCEVHELFTAQDVTHYRQAHPDVVVIAHPECRPEVVRAADFSGSTARMIQYVREKNPKKVFLITECSMSQNVASQFPQTKFVRPCNLCPHMNRITLDKIITSLQELKDEIIINPSLAQAARQPIERMLQVPLQ